MLHNLNICHNDIKPANIVFSPKLKKLVFIDFGFSEVRIEPVGYMRICMAKGSLYYCSDEMKNIFLTTG
jgi:serine/threonine protein kinase